MPPRRLHFIALLLLVAASTACKDDSPTYGDQMVRAMREGQANGARGDLQTVAIGVTNYLTNEGNIPAAANFEELAALLEPAYIKRIPRQDPWGMPYLFMQDGTTYTLATTGVDKTWNTADDMVLVDGQIVKMPQSFTRLAP